MLPDDIFMGQIPALAQLIKVATQERCSVIAVQEVPNNQISRYGVIGIKKQISANLFQVREVIEKPTQSQAPSNYAIIGRYVLSPSIFASLDEMNIGALGEVQLTDGIQHMILQGEKVFAYKVSGIRYDTGTPLEWLKANVALALKHPQFADQMTEYLNELDRDLLLMQGRAEFLGKRMTP
jgi:UTP--glucose-1-phosphate uridylyltransferase